MLAFVDKYMRKSLSSFVVGNSRELYVLHVMVRIIARSRADIKIKCQPIEIITHYMNI